MLRECFFFSCEKMHISGSAIDDVNFLATGQLKPVIQIDISNIPVTTNPPST
jgi:hypothetical protein